MAVYLYYDEDENPGGMTAFPGVPLGPITEDEFKALPKWLQKSLEASKLYRKTNPKPAKAAEADEKPAGPTEPAKPEEK